jgi:hypothetical protein
MPCSVASANVVAQPWSWLSRLAKKSFATFAQTASLWTITILKWWLDVSWSTKARYYCVAAPWSRALAGGRSPLGTWNWGNRVQVWPCLQP